MIKKLIWNWKIKKHLKRSNDICNQFDELQAKVLKNSFL